MFIASCRGVVFVALVTYIMFTFGHQLTRCLTVVISLKFDGRRFRRNSSGNESIGDFPISNTEAFPSCFIRRKHSPVTVDCC